MFSYRRPRDHGTILVVPELESISFQVSASSDDPAGPVQVIPIVSGKSLIERVAKFERSQAFTPAGEYSGLIPAHFRFGDLIEYYLGIEPRQSPKAGYAWLLGCDCGEVGCWPLTARIVVNGRTVTWSNFSQDHRPTWDYTDFGPFIFDRAAYDAAILAAAETIETGLA